MKVAQDSAAAAIARLLKPWHQARVRAVRRAHHADLDAARCRGHPHHRRPRRARRRPHGAGARRTDRRTRGRAGYRRAGNDQRHHRHRQRACLARARAGALRGQSPPAGEPRRPAGHGPHRNWCAPSRAMPARCANRRWSCRSWTRRSRGRSAKAASPAPPTSISRPTRCAASCRRRCSWKSISIRSRARVTRPTRCRWPMPSISCGRPAACWSFPVAAPAAPDPN